MTTATVPLTLEQRKQLSSERRRLERELVASTLQKKDKAQLDTLAKNLSALIEQLGTIPRTRETLKFRAVYKSHVCGGHTAEEALAKIKRAKATCDAEGKGGSDTVALYQLVKELDGKSI